ncbi:MAG TPA: hypothetical protein VF131_02070 [Blastocatellia bacterium]|nr:hypothetical protein [Blastocatellia bacterium]
MEDSISDITIAHITEKASTNENDEINRLLVEKERIIKNLAASLAWRYGIDKIDQDELEQFFRLKLWMHYSKLPDLKSLIAWLSTIGNNFCRNKKRHKKVECAFLEKTFRETQNNKRLGGEPLIQFTSVGTPEDELLERERIDQLERIVREATEPFPKWLVEGWAMGKTAEELSDPDIPGRSLKSVYRKLREMQKAINKAKAAKDSNIKPYEE